MASASPADVKFEIGHVLFIDLVGYSKLLINEQSEQSLIDAGLGRKEEAIQEGRHAVELLAVEEDLPEGIDMIKYFAMIAAWVGDKDVACEQLAIALSGPSSLTYGELKLLPLWDPLRGDPRFEKIVASRAPKEEVGK